MRDYLWGRICGRPTAKKTPCKQSLQTHKELLSIINQLPGNEGYADCGLPCSRHSTTAEGVIMDLFHQVKSHETKLQDLQRSVDWMQKRHLQMSTDANAAPRLRGELSQAETRIKNLEKALGAKKLAKLDPVTAKPKPKFRLRDEDNRQVVVVEGGYTYAWDGEKNLKVGDKVTIPGTMWRDPSNVEIVQLGSDYDGYLVEIIKKVGQQPPTGLKKHKHRIIWAYGISDDLASRSAVVTFQLLCGCRMKDIHAFAAMAREQLGWNVYTSSGHGGNGASSYCFAARSSLNNPKSAPHQRDRSEVDKFDREG